MKNNRRRTKKFILLSCAVASFAFLFVAPAHAAITQGDTQGSGSLLKDFALSDINSSTSVGALKGLVSGITNIFKAVDTWLTNSAGINITGIIKTIGSWMLIVIEWMIALLKALF